MPNETQQAVNWALTQTYEDEYGGVHPITANVPHLLVDKVREYFNANKITYPSFSYSDLTPYF